MTSEEPEPEEEDIPFLHRLELIKELIEAPDEVIEALYDAYGKSMIYSAGGAAGAAAGVVLGGPVGGIVGGVVGKKTAGKFTNDDGPISRPHHALPSNIGSSTSEAALDGGKWI